jgi:hypothetical protein
LELGVSSQATKFYFGEFYYLDGKVQNSKNFSGIGEILPRK